MAENENELSFSLYPYIINNGIRRMYAYKESELVGKGIDLKELPEGAYIITEYEPGQVVEAIPPTDEPRIPAWYPAFRWANCRLVANHSRHWSVLFGNQPTLDPPIEMKHIFFYNTDSTSLSPEATIVAILILLLCIYLYLKD